LRCSTQKPVATPRPDGEYRATMVAWSRIPQSERKLVIDALEREAERFEQDALKMQTAAQKLGRPSLVEHQELRADAFRAAIDALNGIPNDT
jgi:hypothetical protein